MGNSRYWVAAGRLLLATCLLAVPAWAEGLTGPYHGEILRVIDGDTVEARIRIWLDQDLTTLVRIHGIDAPELRGRCPDEKQGAVAARDHLSGLLVAGWGLVFEIRPDKYRRRVVAVLRLPNGQDLGAAMVAAGHARWAEKRRVSWCPP